MLETLLRSIDSRLQKVSDDVGELKVTVTAIEHRLDRMDERFDRMDERFDRMDERFDRMDERFDRMDKRCDATDIRVDAIEGTLTRMSHDIQLLPTWKGLCGLAMAVVAAFGSIVAWLASGGARALARLFE